MKIVDEIKSIQARFARHASRSYNNNAYGEVVSFDISDILEGHRQPLHDTLQFIYNQTGVTLRPTDEKLRVFAGKITGLAKDHTLNLELK